MDLTLNNKLLLHDCTGAVDGTVTANQAEAMKVLLQSVQIMVTLLDDMQEFPEELTTEKNPAPCPACLWMLAWKAININMFERFGTDDAQRALVQEFMSDFVGNLTRMRTSHAFNQEHGPVKGSA